MSATASFLLLNGHDLFSAKFLILRYGLMLFEGIRQELWKKALFLLHKVYGLPFSLKNCLECPLKVRKNVALMMEIMTRKVRPKLASFRSGLFPTWKKTRPRVNFSWHHLKECMRFCEIILWGFECVEFLSWVSSRCAHLDSTEHWTVQCVNARFGDLSHACSSV